MTWSSSDRKESLPSDWAALRQKIFRRDNRLCQIHGPRCTRFATDVDHVGDPGDHREEMLRSACRNCHSTRSAQQGNSAKAALAARRKRPPERHPGRTT